MTFPNGTATSEERNHKNDATDNHQRYYREHYIRVDALGYTLQLQMGNYTNGQYSQATYRKDEIKYEE